MHLKLLFKIILFKVIYQDLVLFFCILRSRFPSTVYWRSRCLFSREYLWIFVKSGICNCMDFYLILYSIPLICVCFCSTTGLLLLLWFCSTAWNQEWQYLVQCSFCLGLIWLSLVFCVFRKILRFFFSVSENCPWDLDWDCTEPIDWLWYSGYFFNIDSSNTRERAIFFIFWCWPEFLSSVILSFHYKCFSFPWLCLFQDLLFGGLLQTVVSFLTQVLRIKLESTLNHWDISQTSVALIFDSEIYFL